MKIDKVERTELELDLKIKELAYQSGCDVFGVADFRLAYDFINEQF